MILKKTEKNPNIDIKELRTSVKEFINSDIITFQNRKIMLDNVADFLSKKIHFAEDIEGSTYIYFFGDSFINLQN